MNPGTDLVNGLNRDECTIRQRKYRAGDIYPSQKSLNKSRRSICVPGSFYILLIIFSLICFLAENTAVNLFTALSVFLNYIFIWILYFRARKKFAEYSYPTYSVKVKRDGKIRSVSRKSLVPGDIIFLKKGSIIPCDARLLKTENFRVLEEHITGGDGIKDPDFISYEPSLEPKYQKNMIFAGSVVSSGLATALVCDTGKNTYAVRSGKIADEAKNDELKLLSFSKKISKITGIFFLFYILIFSLISPCPLKESFMLTLCTSCAAMCDFYVVFSYLIISGSCSIRSKKDAEHRAHIKNISCIEDMKDITCVAVPKIGGICSEALDIAKIYTQDQKYDLYSSIGAKRCKKILTLAAASVPKGSYRGIEGAILSAIERLNISRGDINKILSPIENIPASGTSLFETALVAEGRNRLIICRGNAKQILHRCSVIRKNDEIDNITDRDKEHLLNIAQSHKKDGDIVFALATKYAPGNRIISIDTAQSDLCFEGLFIIPQNILYDSVKETVTELKNNGIKVLLFCDDTSELNYSLALSLGIVSNEGQILTSYDLHRTNLSLIKLHMNSYRLFLGLSSEEKKYVLDYLKNNDNEKIGVITSQLKDISIVGKGEYLNFACYDKKASEKGAQSLEIPADAIIPDAAYNGGLRAVANLIGAASQICSKFSKAVEYLLFSNVLRFIISLFLLFFDTFDRSFAIIIGSGIITDFSIILYLSFCRVSMKDISKRKELEITSSQKKKTVIYNIISALVSASLSFLIPFVLARGDSSSIALSMISCQLIRAFLINAKYEKLFSFKKHAALALLILLQLVPILFIIGTVNIIYLLIPALILCLAEIMKKLLLNRY